MKILLILLGIIMFTACAKQPVVLKTQCRADPRIMQIAVKEGCICGEELKKLIDNHVALWEFIEYLKLKGCKQ